jgi:hypothetical protein
VLSRTSPGADAGADHGACSGTSATNCGVLLSLSDRVRREVHGRMAGWHVMHRQPRGWCRSVHHWERSVTGAAPRTGRRRQSRTRLRTDRMDSQTRLAGTRGLMPEPSATRVAQEFRPPLAMWSRASPGLQRSEIPPVLTNARMRREQRPQEGLV